MINSDFAINMAYTASSVLNEGLNAPKLRHPGNHGMQTSRSLDRSLLETKQFVVVRSYRNMNRPTPLGPIKFGLFIMIGCVAIYCFVTFIGTAY